MRLSANPLLFQTINSYSQLNQWIIRANDPNTLTFQIVDLDQTPPQATNATLFGGGGASFGIPNNSAAALRYLVGIGSSNQPYQVIVTFPSIDNTKVIQLIATQVNANDSSIWSVTIPTSMTPAGGNVMFKVVEGTSIRNFTANQILCVEPSNNGSC